MSCADNPLISLEQWCLIFWHLGQMNGTGLVCMPASGSQALCYPYLLPYAGIRALELHILGCMPQGPLLPPPNPTHKDWGPEVPRCFHLASRARIRALCCLCLIPCIGISTLRLCTIST